MQEAKNDGAEEVTFGWSQNGDPVVIDGNRINSTDTRSSWTSIFSTRWFNCQDFEHKSITFDLRVKTSNTADIVCGFVGDTKQDHENMNYKQQKRAYAPMEQMRMGAQPRQSRHQMFWDSGPRVSSMEQVQQIQPQMQPTHDASASERISYIFCSNKTKYNLNQSKKFRLRKNDCIRLKLNIHERKISLYHNGQFVRDLFENIKLKRDNARKEFINYRFFVSLRSQSGIEFIKCHVFDYYQNLLRTQLKGQESRMDTLQREMEKKLDCIYKLREELHTAKTDMSQKIAELTLSKDLLEDNIKNLEERLHQSEEENLYLMMKNEDYWNSKDNNFELKRMITYKISDKQCLDFALKLLCTQLKYKDNSDAISTILDAILTSPQDAEDIASNAVKLEQDNNNQNNIQTSINEMKRLDSEMSQISSWMNELSSISNVDFNNSFINAFIKTTSLSQKSEIRVAKLCDNVQNVFLSKLKVSKSLKNIKLDLERRENEFNEKNNELDRMKNSLQDLKRDINEKMINYSKLLQNYSNIFQSVERYAKIERNDLNGQIAVKGSVIQTQDNLLQKCREFRELNEKVNSDMESKREQGLEKFEQDWLNWTYQDIIFWFKVKLNYFDNLYESEDEKEESQANINVDFDTVRKHLEDQRIRGKFLSLLNKNDIRNLGFELFEHQCILQQNIEKLVEKYPIPKEKSCGLLSDQEGGVEGQVAPQETKRIDAKYLCPISGTLMKDPVIAYDGVTYEREYIIKYIKVHRQTPQSSETLESVEEVNDAIDGLFDHVVLKKQIDMLDVQ